MPSVPNLVPKYPPLTSARPDFDLRAVLEIQGHHFSAATEGLIQVAVEVRPGLGGRVAYDFELVVPALGDYRYTLFSAERGVEAPPVWIRRGADLVEVPDVEALYEKLRELFADPATVRVRESLLLLAREERGES
jgi:hypothetical protein